MAATHSTKPGIRSLPLVIGTVAVAAWARASRGDALAHAAGPRGERDDVTAGERARARSTWSRRAVSARTSSSTSASTDAALRIGSSPCLTSPTPSLFQHHVEPVLVGQPVDGPRHPSARLGSRSPRGHDHRDPSARKRCRRRAARVVEGRRPHVRRGRRPPDGQHHVGAPEAVVAAQRPGGADHALVEALDAAVGPTSRARRRCRAGPRWRRGAAGQGGGTVPPRSWASTSTRFTSLAWHTRKPASGLAAAHRPRSRPRHAVGGPPSPRCRSRRRGPGASTETPGDGRAPRLAATARARPAAALVERLERLDCRKTTSEPPPCDAGSTAAPYRRDDPLAVPVPVELEPGRQPA